MSYLSPGREDWRASSAYAFAFASVIGPATTLACVGVFFAWPGRNAITSDQHVTIGYRIGVGLTVLIEFLGILVPMAAVCAFGLALFGLPVSRRLGDRLMAGWTAIIALAWGGLSGGVLWAGASALFSDWTFGSISNGLVGAIFGAPTGFWWWFFYSRVLIARAAVQN